MPDGVDRNIAVGIVFAVEEVAGRDRILDQRRVGSVPAAGVHQKTRLREVRSEQVPFSRRIFLGRLDVNTVEIVHPKLRIAVDRHIALVLAFEQHQTLDEPPSFGRRLQGDVLRGRSRRRAVGEGEGEYRVGVEVGGRIEGRVEKGVGDAACSGRGCQRGIEVIVRNHLIDVVRHRLEGVASVVRDFDFEFDRVENGLVTEAGRIGEGYGAVLGQETCRATPESFVVHHTEIPLSQVGSLERVGFVESSFEIGPLGVGCERENFQTDLHLLIPRLVACAQPVVHFRATCKEDHARCGENGGQFGGPAYFTGSNHRIGCSCRKSPLRRATGIPGAVCRCCGPAR